jgi:hypothetical protein
MQMGQMQQPDIDAAGGVFADAITQVQPGLRINGAGMQLITVDQAGEGPRLLDQGVDTEAVIDLPGPAVSVHA